MTNLTARYRIDSIYGRKRRWRKSILKTVCVLIAAVILFATSILVTYYGRSDESLLRAVPHAPDRPQSPKMDSDSLQEDIRLNVT